MISGGKIRERIVRLRVWQAIVIIVALAFIPALGVGVLTSRWAYEEGYKKGRADYEAVRNPKIAGAGHDGFVRVWEGK